MPRASGIHRSLRARCITLARWSLCGNCRRNIGLATSGSCDTWRNIPDFSARLIDRACSRMGSSLHARAWERLSGAPVARLPARDLSAECQACAHLRTPLSSYAAASTCDISTASLVVRFSTSTSAAGFGGRQSIIAFTAFQGLLRRSTLALVAFASPLFSRGRGSTPVPPRRPTEQTRGQK